MLGRRADWMDRARKSDSVGPSRIAKATLICSTLMAAYVVSSLAPVLPLIQASFIDTPHSGLLVRFLVSGIGISMIIGSPLATIAAEHFGRRRVLVVSLSICALFGTAGSVIDDLWLLVASRLLFALGSAASGILLLSLVAEMTERDRNRWLGLLTTLGTSAVLLIVPLVGLLGTISWRLVFLIHGLALLVIPLVLTGLPPDRTRDTDRRRTPDGSPSSASPVPLFLLGIALLIGAIQGAPQMFLAFQLKDIGVTDTKQVSFAMMASLAATVASSAFYATFRVHAGLRAALVISLLLCGVGYVLTGAARELPPLIGGLVLIGTGSGLLIPHLTAVAATTGPPEKASRNMGIARAAFYCGPLASQFLLEPLTARVDAGFGLMILGFLTVLAASMISRLTVPEYRPSEL
jgi:MFS family permease